MITRRTLMLGAAGLGLAGTVGCTRQPSAKDGALTVGLTYIPNVQFSAFYLGLAQGHFQGPRRRRDPAPPRTAGRCVRGDPVGARGRGFASADEGLVSAAQGNNLLTFATSYQRYPIEVIGRTEIAGEGLASLKGRSLGIPGHFGSSYYAALVAIHEAGLTEADVKLIDIGYTATSALTSGNVDFIMGFRNNELVQLEAQGVDVTSTPISNPAEPRLVGPSLLAMPRTLSGPTAAKLANALLEAEKAVIADPGAALDATAKEVPALADPAQRESAAMVLAATIELWKREDGDVSTRVDSGAMNRMADFLVEVGVIDKRPEAFYSMG